MVEAVAWLLFLLVLFAMVLCVVSLFTSDIKPISIAGIIFIAITLPLVGDGHIMGVTKEELGRVVIYLPEGKEIPKGATACLICPVEP